MVPYFHGVCGFARISSLILCSAAYKWGVGLHLHEILATDSSHLLDARKITWVRSFFYITIATTIKLSILFTYHEIFRVVQWFIYCVWATMALCILVLVISLVRLCTTCKPIEANYIPDLPGAKCSMSVVKIFVVSGSVNMALDVFLVLLPLPVVWKLEASRRKKLGISLMFGLGIL